MSSIEIHNEKSVTAEDILNEACKMWNDVKKCGVDKIDDVIPKYRDFCTSYPVVLRYMVLNDFSKNAMRKFLQYVKMNPWKSVDEFIECQSMYVIYLYKERHPHYNPGHVKSLKENTMKILRAEHDEFEELGNSITKEVDEREVELKADAKKKLKLFYATHGEETVDVPLRAAFDIPVNTGRATQVDDTLTLDIIKHSADDLLNVLNQI